LSKLHGQLHVPVKGGVVRQCRVVTSIGIVSSGTVRVVAGVRIIVSVTRIGRRGLGNTIGIITC